MNQKQTSRETLRRYILGELSASQRDAVSEGYFADDDAFDELLDVENELFDQYTRGELTPVERKSFEQYASTLKDGQSRIATAFALARAGSSPFTKITRERKKRFAAGSLRLLPAAAVIIIAAGLTFFFVFKQEYRGSNDRGAAEQPQRAYKPSDNAALNGPSQASPPAEDAHAGPDSRTAAPSATSDRGALTATVVLTPALRSGGSQNSLNVVQATRFVRLLVPIEDESGVTSYRVVIQTTDGDLIFSNRVPRAPKASRYLSVRLAADLLKGNSFKLTLQENAPGETEIARDFYFKIVRH